MLRLHCPFAYICNVAANEGFESLSVFQVSKGGRVESFQDWPLPRMRGNGGNLHEKQIKKRTVSEV